MENKLKFKAFIQELNKICDVIEIDFQTGNIVVDNEKKYWNKTEYILLQSIGLSDKNGKEIFEGDLLKIKDNIYNIIWDMDCLQYFLEKDGFKFCWSDCFDEEKRKFIVEVIGNIYENKELIGE